MAISENKLTDISSTAPVISAKLTSSSLLARNATLNLVTEGWIFVVLLVAMPRLVSFLGETSFGLFSLAWVIIGYLAFLDVGVNRAATKFVSEHLAERNHESVCQIVRTALFANLALGLAGGLAIVSVTPYLLHSVFKVSPDLQGQARLAFYAVALAVPVLLLQGVFRAVLSSFQRFSWINIVNAVTTTALWVAACLLAFRGRGVALVVFSTVLARIVATVAYGVVLFQLLPGLRLFGAQGLHGLPKLLRFGTWVSISQLISPILVYLDRLLIASFVSLSAVTLYTIPYEAVTKLRIIPSSLVATLYPAFSERSTQQHREQLQNLYDSSLRFLLMISIPPTVLLGVMSKDLLSIWMGPNFASKAFMVLQIMAAGVFLNVLAYVPYNALQALGRPDLTGKFHLLELPIYVGLCLLLIPRWGIAGAAMANTLRLALDSVLLFWAAQHYCSCSFRRAWSNGLWLILLAGLLLFGSVITVRSLLTTEWGRISGALIASAFHCLISWKFILNRHERPAILRALNAFR